MENEVIASTTSQLQHIQIPQQQQQRIPNQQQPHQQVQQKKPKARSRGKKVAVTIGHDLDGNPIIVYRKPSTNPIVHLPSHIQTPEIMQSINPNFIHKQSSAIQQQFDQHQLEQQPQYQLEQHHQHQEGAANIIHQLQADEPEVLQNAEDNQLLAVPAENFDGPAGAFYLCKITENNDYIPIDGQLLYLDENNQLVPSAAISDNR